MFSKLPRPSNREQRTACRLSPPLLTISLTFVSSCSVPDPLRAPLSILCLPPNGVLSLLLPSSPPCQPPGSSLITPSKLALRLPGGGGPLPFPSLYLKPLLWAQGGPGSSRCSHFSADPGFTSPRLLYTPASALISAPSTCHSPAPAAAERTKTRAAHLCAAFRARG